MGMKRRVFAVTSTGSEIYQKLAASFPYLQQNSCHPEFAITEPAKEWRMRDLQGKKQYYLKNPLQLIR